MHTTPYLFFNGRTEEALDFYKRAIGAEIVMAMRFGEAPEKPPMPVPDDKIMHAELRIGGTALFASDGDCSQAGPRFEGVSMALSVKSEAEADRVFAALSEGGQVRMPLGPTFWSPRFGMCADRFGLGWMVMVSAQGDGA